MRTKSITDVVAALILLSASQFAIADHEIIFTQEGGFGCQTATFEGGVHNLPIHPENGGLIPGSVIRFSDDWRHKEGGAYANNPSGTDVLVLEAASGEILFEQPVREVSVFYAHPIQPVTMDAYDAIGQLIGSDSGPANAPPLVIWDPIEVVSNDPVISRVVINGIQGELLIDDFRVCGLLTPDVQINNLVADVVSLNLQQGLSNSIDAKLDTALQALDDINQNNDVAAVNALQAFINAVNAQRGNQISNGNADALIAAAQTVIDQLST